LNKNDFCDRKAIVVNDDRTQLSLLTGLLQNTGISATPFESAENALLAMAGQQPPDLIVTDLYMPGIDGWRFCRLLRSPEYADFNEIPILVVSATFSGDHPELIAADIGADAFLPSPVDAKAFLDQVQALMAGKEARRLPQVLIVEDSRFLSELLKKTFAGNGYQVDMAVTVREAQVAFARNAYDVAVLDYHLPDGKGDTLLNIFRAERPHCVCLMMTTDPTPGLALSWMKQGASAYLRKPFEPEFLIELCARARRERAMLHTEDLLEARTRNLRESEERYRLMAENMSDVISLTNMDFQFTYVSPSITRLTGFSVEEAMKHSIEEIMPPQSFKKVLKIIDEEMMAEASGSADLSRIRIIEYEQYKKDRSTAWVESHCKFLRDKDQKPTGILIVTRNITERKQAEDAWQESSRRYRELFENSRDGFVVVDLHGRFLDANKAYCEMLGYSLDQLKAKEDFYAVTPEHQREWEYKEIWCNRLMKTGVSGVYDKEYIRKDGTAFPVELQSFTVKDEKGNIQYLWGIARDISERKKVEEKLADENTRWRILMEQSRDGIVILDQEGRAIQSNRKFADMLGYPIESMDHLKVFDWEFLYPPERVIEMINRVDETGDHFVTQHRRKDGSIYDVEISTNAAWFSGQKLIFCICRDITERKQADAEREKLQAQLTQAQKMESIGTLAGGIAHDFNNILFPIIGHTEMILDDVPDGSPTQNSLKTIHTSALRAKDLVQQILSFSCQEKNELKIIKIQPIIKECLKLIRSTIPSTISISQHLNRDCGPVKANPTQIHQIVMNLATNAYHAMEENGGKLSVTVKEIKFGQYDSISPNMSPGAYACLIVSDTGSGMDKDIVGRIFDPFFTTKETGKGTGIGLSVVYGIVKGMNGDVQVYSEPGKGTQFDVYLPIVGNEVENQTSALPGPVIGGSERVLLVDDENTIVMVEQQILERLGYQVTAFTDSMEALEMFQSGPDQFDLVITDMSMPKMSGDKLSAELVKIRDNIPILLLTGFSDSMTERKIKSIGIKGLIIKPIAIKDLANKIREVLDNALS
jgi:PAS domain S-box-containing protein